MKARLTVFLVLLAGMQAAAASPFLAFDLGAGYDFTGGYLYAWNETIAGWELDFSGGTDLFLENFLLFEDPEFSDCLTTGLGFWPLDSLSIGPEIVLFFYNGTYPGAGGFLLYGLEPGHGWYMEDENELLYYPAGGLEYVNTLYIELLFEGETLGLAMENELAVAEGEAADTLLLGPFLQSGSFLVYANYALTLLPETSHGAEIGIGLEF